MLLRFCALALFMASGLAAQAADHGQPMTPEAIRSFVSGKTVREYHRNNVVRIVFYRADGRAFLVKPDRTGAYAQPATSSWKADDNYLCRPELPVGRPCQAMSRRADGTVLLDYQAGGMMMLQAVDGDPAQLVAFIEKSTADAPARAHAAAEERRGSVPPGNYLSGDEIRQLVSGKTVRETPTERIGITRTVTLIYTAADGTGYLSIDGGQTTWRGPWEISGNRLCLKGAYWPCADFRRTSGGKIMKEYGGPKGSRNVELMDGDPEKVVEIVNNTPPYNQQRPATTARPPDNRPAFMKNTTVR